jgi:hypothetical protein
MGFLKKLDIFRGVNEEHHEGTVLGALLTIVSVFLIFFFFAKEIRHYKFQKLDTKLFVYNPERDLITIKYDISVYNIKCNVLIVGYNTSFGSKRKDKIPEGSGCRLKGEFLTKNDNNGLTISPNFQSSMNEMLGMVFGESRFC